jgi:hypothetical protein
LKIVEIENALMGQEENKMSKFNSILIMLLITLTTAFVSGCSGNTGKYSNENEEEAVKDMKNNARAPLNNSDMSEINKNIMINSHFGIKDETRTKVKTTTMGHMEIPEKDIRKNLHLMK